jgi:protein-S-isoprenylcysteine O-methyltransferase Ste14
VIAVVTLAVFTTLAVLLIGVRAWLQRRGTGDPGIRARGVSPRSVQGWASAVMIVGEAAVGVAAPLADLWGVPAFGVLNRPVLRWSGVGLAVLSGLATFAAQLGMGSSWRIGVDERERTALVTEGPFRLVRNPIFSGMVVTLIGVALAVPNVVAVLGLVAATIGVELQVRSVEEPYLRRLHGSMYVGYASRVGRFVPLLGRLRSRTE